LFFVPLLYFILTLSRFPRIALSITSMLPVAWMEREDSKRIRFAFANKLFQHDRPAKALRYLDLFLHTSRPSIAEDILRALCIYQGFGRFRDAMSQIKRGNDRNLQEADSLGLAHSPYRVLDSVWASHVGQIATLDYVIKLENLEGRTRNETILYLPSGSSVANRFLLREMAKFFGLPNLTYQRQLIIAPIQSVWQLSGYRAIDFGIARWQADPRPNRVRGTETHVAPEECLLEEITPAADIFGLGATLFELLTGKLPGSVQNLSHI